MEQATNILLLNFRHVLVRAAYDNDVRIRFRADKVRDDRVFFNKVPSQHARWREKGGALVTWRNSNLEGPCDALLFAECPKWLEGMFTACRNVSTVAVIYQPPTWRLHEECIRQRAAGKENQFRKRTRRWEVMRYFVERLPWLTAGTCQTLLRSRGLSRPSPAPAPGEAAGRSPDTTY